MVLYTMAAAEITCRMRASYVDTVLKQSITTLDAVNASGIGGANQAIHDIAKVNIGLGEQLGMAMQLISVVASAFVISVVQ
jgi:galactose-1-phosphate uridylyltransferase